MAKKHIRAYEQWARFCIWRGSDEPLETLQGFVLERRKPVELYNSWDPAKRNEYCASSTTMHMELFNVGVGKYFVFTCCDFSFCFLPMVWFLRAFDLDWSMVIKRACRDGLRTAQYVSLYEVDYSTSRDINEFVFTVQCVFVMGLSLPIGQVC